ncbi:unnamed protein product, partial [Ascophyllum nodosum]
REEAAVRDPRASHQPEAGQNEHLNTQSFHFDHRYVRSKTPAHVLLREHRPGQAQLTRPR